jgi:hypothetical protein
MRALIILTVGVTAAFCIPAALALDSSHKLAPSATARACSTLRVFLGPDVFVKQYPSLGTCMSQWAGTADSARLTAQSSCRARGLTGIRLSHCLNTRLVATLTSVLRATAPAMKSCAAELNLLGMNGFTAKYGSAVLSGAFGQCVLPKSTAGLGGAPTIGPEAYSLTFTASPLTGSGVSGTGSVRIGANGLVLSAALSGAEPGQNHAVLILGSTASCDDAHTQAIDQGGSVTMDDGALLISLDPSQLRGSPVPVSLPNAPGPFAGRQVLILGKTLNGSYDQAYPVACGTVSSALGEPATTRRP